MSRKEWSRIGLSLIVALFLWTVSGVKPAAAQTEATCTSTGTGNWNTAGTWSCGHVPAAADDVVIAAGHTVTVNTNTNTLASLTVNGTFIAGSSTTARTITVSGNLTIATGGVVQPGVSNANHILNLAGNLANDGTFNGQASTFREIRVTFNGATDQSVSGTGTTTFSSAILNKGTQASKVIASMNITVGGSDNDFDPGSPSGSEGTWEQTAGTLTRVSEVDGNVDIASDGGLIISGTASFNLNTDDLTSDGIFQVNTSGTVTMGNGNDSLIMTGSSSNTTLTSGTITVNGNVQLTNNASLTLNGANLLIDPRGSSTLSQNTNILEMSGTSNIAMSSGSMTIVDPHNATGNGEAINIASGSGTKSFAGGTFFIGDGSSTIAGSTDGFDIITGGLTLPNLTVNNQGGGSNRFARLVTNALTLSGSLTIQNGGELQANDQNITLAGDWTNNGTFTSGTQTTTFNGTVPQTISGSSVTGFSTWVVNSGATVVVPDTNIPTAAVAVTNNGTLQQTRTVSNANVQFLTISTDRYRGVDIDTTGTGANLGAVTVTVRGNSGLTCPNAGGTTPVYAFRCFDITPTNQGAAAVTLWVLSTEQNGILTSNLAPYRFSSSWSALTSATNGTASNGYSFAAGNTPGFSTFLVGDANFSPTAITLSNAGVVSGVSGLWLGLVGLLLLASVGWWVRGRNA